MVDVDLVQVNFAAFFRWMDISYQELLVELGHPLSAILSSGYATPVVKAECNYMAPVTLNDEIEVTAEVAKVGNSSYSVVHRFNSHRKLIAEAEVRHVWVSIGPPQVAVPVPDWLRSCSRKS